MIYEKTKLADILAIVGAEEVLHKFQVPCMTCPMMKMEIDELTIGNIAKMYALDLEGILRELNKIEK